MTAILDRPDLAGLTDEQLAAAYCEPGADVAALRAAERQRERARQARRAKAQPWHDMAYQQYLAAERELSGVLLNRRGVAKGINPWPALWTGPWHNVEPYMSWELLRWFEQSGRDRITVTQYQDQEREQERAYRDELDRDDRDGVRPQAGSGREGSQDHRDGTGNLVPPLAARAQAQAGSRRDPAHAGRGAAVRGPAVTGPAVRSPAYQRVTARRAAGGCPDAGEPVPAPLSPPAEVAVREPAAVAVQREEIPGAKTLSDARTFLGHFAIWPGEAALDTAALWAAHAHARGADGMLTWQASPRLLFSSAEPGSGKSYAMRLVARICPAPAVFTEPSEPAVAHAIGRDHATLALDEIDVLFGRGQRKAAIRAVINDGYTPDGSWARVRGGHVDRIPTFGALMLAGLDAVETATDGHMRALLTRCIRIRMRRGPDGWRAPRFDADGRRAAQIVTGRLSQWAAQSLIGLGDYVPEVPDGIGNRQAELWEPLLAVAEAAGGRWPEAARAACDELTSAGAVPDEDGDDEAELDRILAGWGEP